MINFEKDEVRRYLVDIDAGAELNCALDGRKRSSRERSY